jgi:hypothetical protein
MKMILRIRLAAVPAILILAFALVAGCAAGDGGGETGVVTQAACIKTNPNCTNGGSTPPVDIAYAGGLLVSQPHVIQVLYGQGTYIPEITRSAAPSVTSFYKQLFARGAYDWMANEYGVGRGLFLRAQRINPAPGNDGPNITDAMIQLELAMQIAAGTLPPPDGHIVYMVHFPAGKTIFDANGGSSFCGYHGAFVNNGSRRSYYAVLPDLASKAAGSCGDRPVLFDNQTSVVAHELAEIMTDPEFGVIGPAGWRDSSGKRAEGEIADVCIGLQNPDGSVRTSQFDFNGHDGHAYAASLLWSQAAANAHLSPCTAHPRSPQDAIWRYSDGTTTIYYDADVVKPQGALGVVAPSWQVATVGDFDGDGYDDIVWGGSTIIFGKMPLSIWWRGQSSSPPPTSTAKSASQGVLGAGDFDGDGLSDILLRGGAGDVTTWPGGAAGAAVAKGTIAVGATASIGDFDGDGTADILWRTVDGTSDSYVIWRAGTQPAVPPIPFAGPGVNFVAAAVGDFDDDGQSDVYFRSDAGQVVIWTSGLPFRIIQAGTLAPSTAILGAGYFDADARSDIYVRQQPLGDLHVLSGGMVAQARSVGRLADPSWSMVGVGSFDF